MITQTFLQDLLNRVDIVDVIESYVPLKRTGTNHVACCPFHNEKTPSFTVSQTKQFYHCFGCGAHGTAIGFVMQYAGFAFIDAVKELASDAGMKVPEFKSERKSANGSDTSELVEIMEKAAQFYRRELKQSPTAIDYLKRRGLNGEVAAKFGIGFAPDNWQNLLKAFSDYQSENLLKLGLVIANDQGKRYDRFRERIMFPIHSTRGEIIGFGGRVLESGEPKYLNSPETPLFEKGRELYGFFQARQAIREAQYVIVVEGYMDVVALAQHGIANVVATLGTATTPVHIQKLLRQTDHIVFCFDGDEAGQRAAWRALENSLSLVSDGKLINFLFLPENEDPDSLVRKIGKGEFEKLLKEAVPLSDFLLNKLKQKVNTSTREGKVKLLEEVKPFIKKLAAPNLGRLIRKSLAEITAISEQELNEIYQIKSSVRPTMRGSGTKPKLSLYRKVLESLVSCPKLALLCGELTVPEATSAEEKALELLLQATQENPLITTTAMVVQLFSETPFRDLIGELEGEILELGDDFDFENHLQHALSQLQNLERQNTAKAVLSTRASPKELSPEERERIRYGGRIPALAEK